MVEQPYNLQFDIDNFFNKLTKSILFGTKSLKFAILKHIHRPRPPPGLSYFCQTLSDKQMAKMSGVFQDIGGKTWSI